MSLIDKVTEWVAIRDTRTRPSNLLRHCKGHTRAEIAKAMRHARAAGRIQLIEPGQSNGGTDFTEAIYGPLPPPPERQVPQLTIHRRQLAAEMRGRNKSFGQIAMRLRVSRTYARELAQAA
jgi:hypothetical protein